LQFFKKILYSLYEDAVLLAASLLKVSFYDWLLYEKISDKHPLITPPHCIPNSNSKFFIGS